MNLGCCGVKAHWKCLAEDCQDSITYAYRGLCRTCSEYDEVGNVTNPVQRTRVDEYGNVIKRTEVRRYDKPITRAEQKQVGEHRGGNDTTRVQALQRKERTRMRKARQAARAEGKIPLTRAEYDSMNTFEEIATSEEEEE